MPPTSKSNLNISTPHENFQQIYLNKSTCKKAQNLNELKHPDQILQLKLELIPVRDNQNTAVPLGKFD